MQLTMTTHRLLNRAGFMFKKSPSGAKIAKHLSFRKFSAWVSILLFVMLTMPVSVFVSDAPAKPPAKKRQHLKKRVNRDHSVLLLRSSSVLVQNQRTGKYLVQKQDNVARPIASITKLMTAMVVLDAKLNLEEILTITPEDVDNLRHSRSVLPVQTTLTRDNALLLALMTSENRAAYALGRTYPGGQKAFVAAMNNKAKSLGLAKTRFADPAGLSADNISCARDLARMINAAYSYPLIRQYTTTQEASFLTEHRVRRICNTNKLLKNPKWKIGLSKTGFINEAGRCIVMQSKVADIPVLIVILNAEGQLTRYGDANRIKKWMENSQTSKNRT